MKRQEDGPLRWHQGITMHKMPVAGVGGLILAIGIVAITLAGLPATKWFLAGAIVLGIAIACLLFLFRKLRPRTEVEEVELNLVDGAQGDASPPPDPKTVS